MPPVSEKQKEYRDKYDKENFQYITFKAKKGAKERIVEAATAIGQSTNGFIRSSLNEAVERATGRPMEDASPHRVEDIDALED
jgi:predicted HicB family RNase H-like nuclease